MIDNLRELNNKINAFVDFVVWYACEHTTSGNYFVSVDEALKFSGLGYDDFLAHKELIFGELNDRIEVLDFEFSEESFEIDVNCGLDYCPHYEWCDGDEEVFQCSYDEWVEMPVKPVYQAMNDPDKVASGKASELAEEEPRVFFTVRDGFGDDIAEPRYLKFDDAAGVLKSFSGQSKNDPDGAMLGIVVHAEDRDYKCVLVQSQVTPVGNRFRSMHNNISEQALAIPEIELGALRAKQMQYPFDEQTQKRVDALEKQLGIFEREVDTSGDLYAGKWRVHIVPPGGRYGLNNNVVHDREYSKVEFYDMSANKVSFPEGQFVSSYSVDGLLSDHWGASPDVMMRQGLCLDYENRDFWSVSGAEMQQVFDWLKHRDLLPGEQYQKVWMDVNIRNCPVLASAADFVSRKLDDLLLVRESQVVHCREFGDPDGRPGAGVGVIFKTQADRETIEKALKGAFSGFQYDFSCEKKVVAAEKEPLDNVISSCEASKVKEDKSAERGKESFERDD